MRENGMLIVEEIYTKMENWGWKAHATLPISSSPQSFIIK